MLVLDSFMRTLMGIYSHILLWAHCQSQGVDSLLILLKGLYVVCSDVHGYKCSIYMAKHHLVSHSRWIAFLPLLNVSHSISRGLENLFFISSSKCITYIGIKILKSVHDNFCFMKILVVAMA